MAFIISPRTTCAPPPPPMLSTTAASHCQYIWRRSASASHESSPCRSRAPGREGPVNDVRKALGLHSATRMPLFPDPVTREGAPCHPSWAPGTLLISCQRNTCSNTMLETALLIYEVNLAKFDAGEHLAWTWSLVCKEIVKYPKARRPRVLLSCCFKRNLSRRNAGKGTRGEGEYQLRISLVINRYCLYKISWSLKSPWMIIFL